MAQAGAWRADERLLEALLPQERPRPRRPRRDVLQSGCIGQDWIPKAGRAEEKGRQGARGWPRSTEGGVARNREEGFRDRRRGATASGSELMRGEVREAQAGGRVITGETGRHSGGPVDIREAGKSNRTGSQ